MEKRSEKKGVIPKLLLSSSPLPPPTSIASFPHRNESVATSVSARPAAPLNETMSL